ncbi:HlyD family secretion protein [Oleispirillum naphthae]|uniref:HlyD family secretion protein n=1 Tax=Oleispirillum naphthae TaxID=2838853 RepID=UPI003082330A
MRKRLILGAAAAALCIGGYSGWSWYGHGRFIESTDNAYVSGDIVAIAPKVPGRIAALAVADNQPVKAGDLLLRLDDADYRAAVDQAQGQLDAAAAAVAVVDGNIAVAGSSIAEAEAALASAQAERTRASADLARYKTLEAAKYASQQKMQTAQADAGKAAAEVRQGSAALATAKSRLALLSAQRRQAEAEEETARAALAAARIRLADTELRAPVDGVVGNKGVQLGQYVQPGQQTMSVVPVAGVFVVANFKETQLSRMRQGQPVTITVDAYRGRTLHGALDSVSPGSGAVFSLLPPENATGNFTKIVQRIPVKILLDDAARQTLLLPGMSVEAKVDTRGSGAGLSREDAFAAAKTASQTAAR